MNFEKQDARLGLLVLGALALFLALVAYKNAGAVTERSYPLVVRLEQMEGLAPGTDVQLKGFRVGSVERVDMRLEGTTYHFLARIAVREASAEAAAEAKGDASVEPLSDDTLRTRMSARRVTLCDALKHNLPSGSGAMADVLRIRKDRRHPRHAENNRVLLAIFRDAELVKWLRALPKGEGAALEHRRRVDASSSTL